MMLSGMFTDRNVMMCEGMQVHACACAWAAGRLCLASWQFSATDDVSIPPLERWVRRTMCVCPCDLLKVGGWLSTTPPKHSPCLLRSKGVSWQPWQMISLSSCFRRLCVSVIGVCVSFRVISAARHFGPDSKRERLLQFTPQECLYCCLLFWEFPLLSPCSLPLSLTHSFIPEVTGRGRRGRQMHTWFIFVKRGRRKQREREKETKQRGSPWVSPLHHWFIHSGSAAYVCLSFLDCASLHLCVLYLAYTICIISHLEGSFHPKCFAVVWVWMCTNSQQFKVLEIWDLWRNTVNVCV